jgi:hypothetical protein
MRRRSGVNGPGMDRDGRETNLVRRIKMALLSHIPGVSPSRRIAHLMQKMAPARYEH